MICHCFWFVPTNLLLVCTNALCVPTAALLVLLDMLCLSTADLWSFPVGLCLFPADLWCFPAVLWLPMAYPFFPQLCCACPQLVCACPQQTRGTSQLFCGCPQHIHSSPSCAVLAHRCTVGALQYTVVADNSVCCKLFFHQNNIGKVFFFIEKVLQIIKTIFTCNVFNFGNTKLFRLSYINRFALFKLNF